MAASDPSQAQEVVTPEPKRRRRWPKFILLAFLLLVGVLVVAWFLAPGLVASNLERALEESLAVEATVLGVSISPTGSADIENIRLVDLQGREVAGFSGVHGQASLSSLIKGSLLGEASIELAVFQFYEEEDGSWSFETLARKTVDGDGESEEEQQSETGSSGLPDLDFTFRVPRIDVGIYRQDGTLESMSFDLEAEIKGGEVATLKRLGIGTSFLTGSLVGRADNISGWMEDPTSALLLREVVADLRYTPDELRRVLEPFVEVELEGSEEEPLVLRAQGDLDDLTAEGVLRDLKATIEAGVGRLTLFDFTAEGDVQATLEGGRLLLKSDLGLNGGAFDLQADVDAAGLLTDAGARDTTFSVGLAGVGVGAELAPLLSALHPMLAANQALSEGGLDGTVDARISFSIGAPLVLSELQEDPESFPLNSLSAEGSLGLAAALTDIPIIQELSKALGVDLSDGAKLAPFAFSIRDGRVGYAKPWTWTIDGLKTSFTGSVGLDQSLDLVWNVPITERLAGKSSFLEHLSGQQLTIPMGGSLLDPKLDLVGALQAVAGDALRNTLEDELLDQLEGIGLGGLDGALEQFTGQTGLGGRSRGESDVAPAQSNDPVVLYSEANRLWKAGDRAAAQPLYKRIKKEFRLSPTYLLNRSRIKKRADWKPN